ncbi:alpha/beta fold hydrolase [Microbacterium sp. BWT-B31]|uniref:alpha/beta fold hydrolase n=1 Tax=Microbacterium sp. BWT-B31 TaxID=3232072 RepID=UPI003528DF3B
MDIVLVPGMWLGGWAWYAVAPLLEAAGHRPHPVTLPGMERGDVDRSATLADAVAAVVAQIDACDGPVVLVGHSAACGVASLAVDARPDRVARAIYVAGFPATDGQPLVRGYEPVDGVVPLPAWSQFDDADVRDLGEGGMAALTGAAVPTPWGIVGDAARFAGDERRYDVPVTAIATEYSSADLREWIAAGAPQVQEFTRIRDLTFVDIPTGHWPMLTRPDDLAEAILAQPPIGTGRIRAAVSAKRFHEAPGLEEWRVLYWGAYAFYATGSFAEAARFTAAIGDISAAVGHEPDVDVRPRGVTVRTFTRSDGGLSESDVDLAQRVSAVARELGLRSDPTQVQQVGIAVAEAPDADSRPFWAAAFGYDELGLTDAVDRHRRGPHLSFQPLESGRSGRGRMHVDVSVPREIAEARVQAAVAAGGRVADASHAPMWWTLASPDNHGVDIAAWPDFEGSDHDRA